jgi:hypothetical protein
LQHGHGTMEQQVSVLDEQRSLFVTERAPVLGTALCSDNE